MIVSHKHKFVYIKPSKTAGTSIQKALCEIVGPEDIVVGGEGYMRQQHTRGFNTSHGHQSLQEVYDKVPESKDYFVFTSERNSWDKMFSWFFMFSNTPQGFLPWVKRIKPLERHHGSLYGWTVPNFVIQYHTLEIDWCKLQKLLDLELPPLAALRANKRPKHSYTQYYDIDARLRVGQIFKKEIAMYDYIFGGQDTHTSTD